MIAYVSPSERVLAVFKNHWNKYRIYVRRTFEGDFMLFKARNLCNNEFYARDEAEEELRKYVEKDESFLYWRYFDYWRGEFYRDRKKENGNSECLQ
ncbi:MAG: hypothetical protein Q4G33_06435 [bacterium]|nr:hypothetical protein [bacterium]